MPQIFVGNLPYTASEADLRFRFEQYGRVTSVRIMTDIATRRPRGFAFVNMPSLDDADEAITRLSGSSMGGRQLTINEADRKPSRTPSASTHSDSSSNRILELFKAIQEEQPVLQHSLQNKTHHQPGCHNVDSHVFRIRETRHVDS